MNFSNIFAREFARIFRHKDLRGILLVSPLLYAFLLPPVYMEQRLKNLPVGLVDRDHSQLSRELTRQLDATEGVSIADSFIDQESALEALRNHEVEALLAIPRGFSRAFQKKKGAVAAIGVSSSNLAVAGPILISSSSVAQSLSAQVLGSTIMARNVHRTRATTLSQPLAIDVRPIYNPEMNQSDAMIPGILFVILQQVVIMGLCLIMAEEQEMGLSVRPLSSWRSKTAFVFGKTLPYAVTNLFFSVSFFCFLLPIFNIGFHIEKLPAFMLLSAAFAVTVSLAGFVFGLLFKDRITVMIVLMFYSLPGFMASGYSWPDFALPWDIRVFSYFFPITHFVEEIRRVILGPIGLEGYLHSLLALTLYSLVCFVLSLIILQKKSRLGSALIKE